MLVISLKADGRGQVVTQGLHLPDEMNKVQSQYVSNGTVDPAPSAPRTSEGAAATKMGAVALEQQIINAIRGDIDELKQRLTQLREDMDQLVAANERIDGDLRSLKDALGA